MYYQPSDVLFPFFRYACTLFRCHWQRGGRIAQLVQECASSWICAHGEDAVMPGKLRKPQRCKCCGVTCDGNGGGNRSPWRKKCHFSGLLRKAGQKWRWGRVGAAALISQCKCTVLHLHTSSRTAAVADVTSGEKQTSASALKLRQDLEAAACKNLLLTRNEADGWTENPQALLDCSSVTMLYLTVTPILHLTAHIVMFKVQS